MLMDAVTSCDTGVIQILYADLNRMPFKASNSFVAFSITPEGPEHDLGMVIRTFGSFSAEAIFIEITLSGFFW